MYLPRNLISQLYQHLAKNHHPQSSNVLILVALEPDALCACRILTALLKRDYIAHKIQPISGYADLEEAGRSMVRPMRTQNGGSGGVVVCLGVGGMVDMSTVLALDTDEEGVNPSGGIEIWLIDARRPWSLGNVFAGDPIQAMKGASPESADVDNGRIGPTYKPGQGGIIVYDDGDIDEDLSAEREAYCELYKMQDVEDYGTDSGDSGDESDVIESIEGGPPSRKRKSWSDRDEEDVDNDGMNGQRRQRRRSNSARSFSSSSSHHSRNQNHQRADRSSNISPASSPRPNISATRVGKQPSIRTLRRRLHRIRKKHTAILEKYYALGASYSEPISSILYSLAEDLGREDNDLLWYAIVGVSSLELYGRRMTGVGISTALDSGGSAGWGGERGERIRQVLRDEVRRLNPPDPNDTSRENARGEMSGVIPTTGRSPTDNSIRLSPEPRFLLIRHWSLYDSMLHSPYLASRLHIWSDVGRKRLHKLLAKMGVSLTQCKQNYTHMDMELKRSLRQRLLTYAPMYGLDGLVPPAANAGRGREGWGFVRSWGWKACLSAVDVGVIVGSILEGGKSGATRNETDRIWDRGKKERMELVDEDGKAESEEWVQRFWDAYDALDDIEDLKRALPIAQHLHRAILRTGTSLIEKRQIRHLRAFRMAVVKDGPDVALFTHPAALTKLALWVGEAIAEQEKEQRGKIGKSGRGTPLVMAGLNDSRGVYVVVGTGGGGGVIDFAARAERKLKLEAKAAAREAKATEKAKRRKEKEDRLGEDAEDEEEESEDEDEDYSEEDDDDDSGGFGAGKNRFGNAFQEVIDETNARVRIDSFEHCVVEVKKEDLSGFLEGLSMKTVVG